MKSKIILLCLLFTLSILQGQSDFAKQQTQYVAYNIGLNGVVGGLGSLINKKSDQTSGQAFWRGFKHGALGGSLILLGKQATYRIYEKQNLGYGLLAKLSVSAGASITQNAAANKHFWERWHLNLPMIRTEYDFKNRHFNIRIKPSNIATLAILGGQAKINWKKSVQIGALFYEKEGNIEWRNIAASGLAVFDAFGFDNRIVGDESYYIAAHELMHVLQYDANSFVNPFMIKQDQKWKAKSKFYNSLSKIFYFDMNAPIVWLGALRSSRKDWPCRLMEREADHFSRKRVWPKCN